MEPRFQFYVPSVALQSTHSSQIWMQISNPFNYGNDGPLCVCTLYKSSVMFFTVHYAKSNNRPQFFAQKIKAWKLLEHLYRGKQKVSNTCDKCEWIIFGTFPSISLSSKLIKLSPTDGSLSFFPLFSPGFSCNFSVRSSWKGLIYNEIIGLN